MDPSQVSAISHPQELGNSLDKCKNNENLQQILTNATIMVVSVTASTTQGCVHSRVPVAQVSVSGGQFISSPHVFNEWHLPARHQAELPHWHLSCA